ncbi:hypothetical protein N1851_031529 [Merluccius polli]|uniref:Uncharacterized protein n=1 Tax=Merluccius polli TaxID=89951 RepID=A0AA47NPX3_MERPO|nr:hypothetical protein N1851_031529 [Merluccius polli]
MTFVLLHIIYQITVNSLLATHSINADFNFCIFHLAALPRLASGDRKSSLRIKGCMEEGTTK